MELNKDKIKQLKELMGLSWQDIADKGNLRYRQHAYDKLKSGSLRSAEFFGKIFNVEPKDLIK